MSALDDAPMVHAEDRATWRAWLEANHATSRGAWLVTWRRSTGRPLLEYEDAVEEALCFGWIDSTGGRVDDERGKLYFAPRRPGSGWAGTNKARVARLEAAGLMAPAGAAAVELAKATGTWTMLDEVENLVVPPDLATALAARPPAADRWESFSRSARRMMLEWVRQAKRPGTRATRIAEVAERAAAGELAGPARPRP